MVIVNLIIHSQLSPVIIIQWMLLHPILLPPKRIDIYLLTYIIDEQIVVMHILKHSKYIQIIMTVV